MDLRIDKFLKVSRLIKRRTVASQACEGKKVLLNGKEAKPGAQVKIGDEIAILLGQVPLRVRVLTLSEHALKEQAGEMYEVVD